MIQGIQAQKIQFPGQNPGVDHKPPIIPKKEPSIGAALAGKPPIGAENKKSLDIKA
jgi:hypothetical protein